MDGMCDIWFSVWSRFFPLGIKYQCQSTLHENLVSFWECLFSGATVCYYVSFRQGRIRVHPRSLTARPWKMMVWRQAFPFGMVIFQGRAVKLPAGRCFFFCLPPISLETSDGLDVFGRFRHKNGDLWHQSCHTFRFFSHITKNALEMNHCYCSPPTKWDTQLHSNKILRSQQKKS